MKKVSLAKKYTRALAETIDNNSEYMTIKSELEQFAEFLNSDLKLKAGIETMLLGFAQKLDILNIYKNETGIGDKVYNFLKILIENNRISYLETIMEVFEDQWYESRGIEKFMLISAVELDKEQENNLREKLENALGKDVAFDKKTDPSLLAGIKLRKGSIYYDFSIEGNLKKLRESLTGDESI